jgi:hypothetical protein
MNIIFGKQEAEKLNEKYIVLELDTVTIKSSDAITAYCVVERIPFEDFPKLADLKEDHAMLMECYRHRQWDFCLKSIDDLTGEWGGELDTFYSELRKRISTYKIEEPGSDWTGVIAK